MQGGFFLYALVLGPALVLYVLVMLAAYDGSLSRQFLTTFHDLTDGVPAGNVMVCVNEHEMVSRFSPPEPGEKLKPAPALEKAPPEVLCQRGYVDSIMGAFCGCNVEKLLGDGGNVWCRIVVCFPSSLSCCPKAYFTRHTFGSGTEEQGDTGMKPAILAGLIFWGTMARVLSELMTWSVEHTQQGLLWLCNGMWAGAAGMVVYAGYRWFRFEEGKRTRRSTVNIKTGFTLLLLSLPLLTHAGVREELMALEAESAPPSAAAAITASPVPAPSSLMVLPDGRRANMKDYAVVLFMQAHCEFSAKFDPLLKGWADEHAIKVYPYTLDGGGDVSFPTPMVPRKSDLYCPLQTRL